MTDTYLLTRVSIFADRLFSQEQLAQLLELPLDTIIEQYDLQGVVNRRLPPQNMSLAIDRALLGQLLYEYSVLLRPLQDAQRNFLMHWARKFELFNLKALIRGKLHDLSIAEIERDLHQLPSPFHAAHDALLQAENLQELLRILDHGPFAFVTHQTRQASGENSLDLFTVDAGIDRAYYAGLAQRLHRVAEPDRTQLSRLVGLMLDRQNLLWLLRYRFVYRLNPGETYYLLVPAGRQLDRRTLLTLCNLETIEEVLQQLPDRLRQLLHGTDSLLQIAQRVDRSVREEALRLVRHSPSPVTRCLAYLVMRQRDLKRLFAILQGKILGLDGELLYTAVDLDHPEPLQEAS